MSRNQVGKTVLFDFYNNLLSRTNNRIEVRNLLHGFFYPSSLTHARCQGCVEHQSP